MHAQTSERLEITGCMILAWISIAKRLQKGELAGTKPSIIMNDDLSDCSIERKYGFSDAVPASTGIAAKR